jgi:predicted ABC-type ATPase
MPDEKQKTQADPHVVVFAGPNGSGKTSLIDDIKETGLATVQGVYQVPALFINPDQVAKDLQGEFPNQGARDLAAAKAAVNMRAEAMDNHIPFAFETVMSHPSRINEMLMLKEQGYKLFLTFITTDDPEKNVARVTLRYETQTTTGHYVDPEKVRDRYDRTLALLPRAAELADAVYVYDNSTDFQKASLQAVIERDQQFMVAPDAKEWVLKSLVYPLQQRERELDQLISMIEKKGHGLTDTDELNGAYKGSVLFKTTYYLAQLDEKTNQATIHDRLMLDSAQHSLNGQPITYSPKELLTISYSPQNAPKVERHERDLTANEEQKSKSIKPKKPGL